MTSVMPDHARGGFSALRLLKASEPVERCELCSAGLGADHPHLTEPPTRRLLCACDACAVLFDAPDGRYRRIPRDIRTLPAFVLSDARWDSLLIPIEIAFFFESSPAGRVVAMYPSPAGATESLLSLDHWRDIVGDNPVLKTMKPDVEALVVNRISGSRERRARTVGPEYYLLPIDQCFKLVGLIRLHWKGLSGGTVVWTEIAAFFDTMRARGAPSSEVASA